MVIFHNSGGRVAINPDRVAYVRESAVNTEKTRIYFSEGHDGQDWIVVNEDFDVVVDRLAGVEGSR